MGFRDFRFLIEEQEYGGQDMERGKVNWLKIMKK